VIAKATQSIMKTTEKIVVFFIRAIYRANYYRDIGDPCPDEDEVVVLFVTLRF
jgi:hypothetical protein